MKNKISTDYLVIGAGLAGCGIALELARNGKSVTLIEQDHSPMNRASLRNEGKIHLGLIYAGDETGSTSRIQLKGSLCFYSILKSWLGGDMEKIDISRPFVYLVAHDSLLSAEKLADHYQALEMECKRMLDKDDSLNYLGIRPEWLAKRIPLENFQNTFNVGRFKSAFITQERAIDTLDLANVITNAVKSNNQIRLITDLKVIDIVDNNGKLKVVGKIGGGHGFLEIDANVVFNAAWDQRLLLDDLIGLKPSGSWVHRLKYRVIASLPDNLDHISSATIVLGAYGDAVIRKSSAYLSWYPAGMTGWSHNLTPPTEWSRACSNYVSDYKSMQIGNEILARTLDWYPGLRGSSILTIDAGAIFAYGNTDIDQIDSELHDRSHIGIRRVKNYISVDPGKLTTAPMFAVEAVKNALYSS